jgi:regulator of RNase E activity RraA
MTKLVHELLATIRSGLSTSLLGDALDAVGRHHQFLPQPVRPLAPEMRLAGIAMPVVETAELDADKPFGLMFEALDSLRPGEVYLAGGEILPCAMWGELMTKLAQERGSPGAVLNGYVRDTPEVLELGFPVFCRGSYAQDQRVRGRVAAFRTRIEIEGVAVEPGDVVVGDRDGVLVLPGALAEACVDAALRKRDTEADVRKAILQGTGAVDIFRSFDVL